MADARLAIRKVAWRALLQGILHERPSAHETASKRLGRINDFAYKDWSTFLDLAGQRLGVDLTATPRDSVMENRVEVFQFLRCILGPVVESFLLLDRKLWLKRELEVSLREHLLVFICEVTFYCTYRARIWTSSSSIFSTKLQAAHAMWQQSSHPLAICLHKPRSPKDVTTTP